MLQVKSVIETVTYTLRTITFYNVQLFICIIIYTFQSALNDILNKSRNPKRFKWLNIGPKRVVFKKIALPNFMMVQKYRSWKHNIKINLRNVVRGLRHFSFLENTCRIITGIN